MSADDFQRASELRDADADVQEPNWTPGGSIIGVESGGEYTLYRDDVAPEDLYTTWLSCDAEHAIEVKSFR